ncbi:MAG: UDP-N-acetyl-D-mannosamine transferase [Gammaproteobacteria bacterium RIFCSPHIGHO2_12_FULL_35_23]|nr:MAG: UDP-N-acetyl-D-mannosamine transferase [Gammaproteobacteria bacterium RIFCSPHIGHO2_12_FULL_35_23]
MNSKEQQFFGIRLSLLTKQETVAMILNAIANQHSLSHCVVNVAKLVNAQHDEHLRSAINQCDLINVDGMGIVWGARFLGIQVPERVAGIDLMLALLKEAELKAWSVYFLGAEAGVLKLAVQNIRQQFPQLNIVGWHHGYFKDNELEVVSLITAVKPDLLFIGMSSPYKESFINRYSAKLKIPFLMGVGGSLDVMAGKVKRAPKWMQQLGLEWLFRLSQEPRRMWRRYLVTNAIFLYMLGKAKLQ